VYHFTLLFPLPETITTMSLTQSDVQKIARLARLSLTEAEVSGYADSLTRILAMVEELERADTAKVEPMSHPLPGLTARLRPDEVTESDQRQLYQRNAPQVEAGLYLVPKVIE
jgi:aspartyl-tRNA(Asn)/glutamyl-tRNA(Gln) amidotransferase subunit C